MRQYETRSTRRPLRFWGWGYQDENLTAEEDALVESTVSALVPGGAVELAPPGVDEFDLPESRVKIPASLEPILSNLPYDRLVHTYGKSYADIARMLLRRV